MSARRFIPPRPLVVETDGADQPRTFGWRGRTERVIAIAATWEDTAGWWRGAGDATHRRCYRVVTASGLRATLHHDLLTGGWYLGAIAD